MNLKKYLGERIPLNGNQAAALAGFLCWPQVIAAYPVTPNTPMIEVLANLVEGRKGQTQYSCPESEHSVLTTLIGASIDGSRTFSGTSSQGLLLMHEPLQGTSRSRLPIVLAITNRALWSPWNIWPELSDSLSQRDTGWIQIYCETNQEVLDSVIQAFKIAERVFLPAMVCYEGFILSHTLQPVSIPTQKEVDEFLPKYRARYKINCRKPASFGGTSLGDPEYAWRMQKSMELARKTAREVHEEFERKFGRKYRMLEPWNLDGKRDLVLVTAGVTSSIAKDVIEKYPNVGLLRIRFFRPFPIRALRFYLSLTGKVAVIDRALSFGAEGQFGQEVKWAMYGAKTRPLILSYIAGMGGEEINDKTIKDCVEDALKTNQQTDEVKWL